MRTIKPSRRQFLSIAAAAAAAPSWPLAGLAEGIAKVPRVALIDGAVPTEEMQIGRDLNYSAFLDEMEKKGFVEGKSVIYQRYLSVQGARAETVQNDARQILATAPDLIAISGNTPLTLILESLDKTTPMVIAAADLLALGIVTDIAHPGANVTGLSVNASPDFEGKMVSILAETVPAAKRVGYAQSGMDGQFRPEAKPYIQSATQAAARLGLTMVPIVYTPGGGEDAWKAALKTAQANSVKMIVFGTDKPLSNNVQQASLAMLAIEAKIATIAAIGSYAESGGLLGYGTNYPLNARGKADYVALILNGAKAGDLPVLQPTAYDFVVNQKTARAIGVTIPQSILLNATEVIQ
jgi:ABC-type uncharacterized transport system substrate-binding protein